MELHGSDMDELKVKVEPEDDDEGIVKIDTIRKPGSRSSLRKEGSSHTRRLTLSNRFNSI